MSQPPYPADDAADGARAPDLFDRRLRNMRRGRGCGDGCFDRLMADLLIERVDDVARRFGRALIIGARNAALIAALRRRCDAVTVTDGNAALAARYGGICTDEDELAVEPGHYDLVVWPGGMESVNDVPSALLRARLALTDDGLLLGTVPGEASFPALRRALAAGDAPAIIARMHPQLSLQSVGDILQKIGLALIVTDVERIALAYRTLDTLAGDLRDAAMTNVLANGRHRLTRRGWARACEAFAAMAQPGSDGAGRTNEQLRLICFSGWAPHASQPRPARRGSATVSLAGAIGRMPGVAQS